MMRLLFAEVFLLVLTMISSIKVKKCPKECTCDETKLKVACVGKNLTHIPPTINEITLRLDLRSNNLQMLSRGAFMHTPFLTHLNLQHSKIITVKEGAFRSLGRLVHLNLANNRIDILYQESFDGLSSLKELHLDHNRIEEIQPGAFSQLGFLNMLTLNHNHLVYIPNMAFQGLQNIKWLRLNHNSLNNLAPEAFAGLLTLSHLNLDHNELQFFPTHTMTRLPEVTRLDISYNPMTYLGEESVFMAKLKQLHLSHMSIQDLSDQAFSRAPLLSLVDLSYNQLHYLEPLSGTKDLLTLNLTGNPVYCNCFMRPVKEWTVAKRVKLLGTCSGPPHLSDELLQNVTSLDLRCRSRGDSPKEEEEGKEQENKGSILATTKPKQIVRCPSNCQCDIESHHATCESSGHTKVPRGFPIKTQLLDLRGNHFHFIPARSFSNSGHVVSLHLEFCKIHEIENNAFQGMKSLLYLYLSENKLTSLSPRVFTGVPELTYLHLEGNNLSQFPGSALSILPNLFVLHLERNYISKLEPEGLLFSATTTLRKLYLSNNTISVITQGTLNSTSIETLHLDSNQLTEIPTPALSELPNLEELNLSLNPISWIGPKAFKPSSQSLRRLHLDHMGIQKMSKDALVGLGLGLTALTVRGNQLKELPDLSPLSRLEVVDLQDNPLMCDCALLPLYRWIKNVRLEVKAACDNPLKLRGQQVRDLHVFNICPESSATSDKKTAVKPRTPKNQRSKHKISKLSTMKTRVEKVELGEQGKKYPDKKPDQ